ncbi:unnamed protein product [Phytomonas sp. EM1]|nr:unnamed protein product [Phytomonas sp. EM1]|eukprot:CCW65132.1 unnamed protein product [Phytomonas sp. isolate EM1]
MQFYTAQFTTLPVSMQQVREFNPQLASQSPTFRLSDGTVYYGEVDRSTGLPQGRGIACFKVVTINPAGAGNNNILQTPPSTSSSPLSAPIELSWSTQKTLLQAFRIYRNGDRYGGQWSQGRFEGEGVLITSSFAYQGGWSDSHMHGKAVIQYERSYVDYYPNDGGDRALDLGVSTLLLRGLSYLSPFEDTALKPKEYIGDMEKSRLRHGYGIMRYYNGDVYEGKWFNNRRHGQGKLLRADGEIYEGMWERDERHGAGTIQSIDGTCFKGMLEHNLRSGEGVMVFTNGDEYYGNFSRNHIDGHGTMRFKNGDVYVGNWKNGIRHGEGKYTLKRKGAIVRGNFSKGLIEGNGTVELPGVSLFVGVFERGERIKGTVFWNANDEGEKSAIAVHEEDSTQLNPSEGSVGKSGECEPSTSSPSLITQSSSSPKNTITKTAISSPTGARDRKCYQGEWVGENMHGKGLLWYRNGDFYYGFFHQNKRHGAGNHRYAEDGREFSGNFVDDVRQGFGVEQSADRLIKAGWWEQDVFVEGYHGEWDGRELHGVGRLRLAVETFLHQDCRKVYTRRAVLASRPSPSILMDFFGIFQDGLRNGEGLLRLPFLPLRGENGVGPTGEERRYDLYGPCVATIGRSNEKKPPPSKDPSRPTDGWFPRQHVIKARWKDDVLETEDGVWAFPSGDVYCGPFSNGLRAGPEGRLWMSNGSVYVGEWRENTPCGEGYFYAKNTFNPIYVRPDVPHARPGPEAFTKDSPSPPCYLTTSDNLKEPDSDVRNLVFSLWGAPSGVEDGVKKNHPASVESPTQPLRRGLVDYRDDYVLMGRWNRRVLPIAAYKELVAPQLNEVAVMKKTTALRGSTIAQVVMRGYDALGKGKPPSDAPPIAPIKAPSSIPLGEHEGLSIVLYTSGVWVQTFFIGNYPMMVTPYLPGSAFDCYLQRLHHEGHLPKGCQVPSHTSSFTTSLRAVMKEVDRPKTAVAPAKGARSGDGKETARSGEPMDKDYPKRSFEMEANTVALGINTPTAQRPFVRSSEGKGGEDLAPTSVDCCTFCKKNYNFFRSPKSCTLCMRSGCASCLIPMESTSSRQPDIDALIARSLMLQQRVLQHAKNQIVNKDTNFETYRDLSAQGITSVPVCTDCTRSVMLGIQTNIIWIPMQIINSVLFPVPMKTPERNKSPLESDRPNLPEGKEESGMDPNQAVPPIETDSDVTTVPSVITTMQIRKPADGLGNPAFPTDPRGRYENAEEKENPCDEVESLTSSNSAEVPLPTLSDVPSSSSNLFRSPGGLDEREVVRGCDDGAPAIPPLLRSQSRKTPSTDYIIYAGYTSKSIPHLWGELWWGGENKGYYNGGFCFGERHGYGTQIMVSGEKYEGWFRHNLWSGKGNYFLDDGSVLHGIFRRGKLRRLCYHGEVDSRRRPHGRGVSYEANGSIYNGEWHHGERRGTGVLQNLDGRIYSGEFRNGNMNGKGKLIEGGNVYYGEFVASLKHGKGVEFSGLYAMEGQWVRGLSSGYCKIWDSITSELYETTYHEGKERDDCFLYPVKVEDRLTLDCANCKTSFSLFLRRHHCRLCGDVFCDACTQPRATLPDHFSKNAKGGEINRANLDAQRVCNACFSRLQQRRMVAIKRYADKSIYAGCWSQRQWVSRGLYCRPDGLFIVMDKHGKPILEKSAANKVEQAGSGNNGNKTSETCVPNGDSTAKKSTLACDEVKLQDASPLRDTLKAFTESSPYKELELFSLWWTQITTECKLMVPLELPLIQRCEGFRQKLLPTEAKEGQLEGGSPADAIHTKIEDSTSCFPKPPVVPSPKLFVCMHDAYHEHKVPSSHENPESQNVAGDEHTAIRNPALINHESYDYEDENVHSAVLRAAKFAPEIIPRPPPLPLHRSPHCGVPHKTLSNDCIQHENPSDTGLFPPSEAEDTPAENADSGPYAPFLSPPPRFEACDRSDAVVLTKIVEERLRCFPEKQKEPARLISPTPVPPPHGTNAEIRWEDWGTREVPTYKGNAPREGQPSAAPSEALGYVSCPFWRPHTTDAQGMLVAGKMTRAVELMRGKDCSPTTQGRPRAVPPAPLDAVSDLSSEDSLGSPDGIVPTEPKAQAGRKGNSSPSMSHNGRSERWDSPGPHPRPLTGRAVSAQDGRPLGVGRGDAGWLPAPLTGPFRFHIQTLPLPAGGDRAGKKVMRVKVAMRPYGLKNDA